MKKKPVTSICDASWKRIETNLQLKKTMERALGASERE